MHKARKCKLKKTKMEGNGKKINFRTPSHMTPATIRIVIMSDQHESLASNGANMLNVVVSYCSHLRRPSITHSYELQFSIYVNFREF